MTKQIMTLTSTNTVLLTTLRIHEQKAMGLKSKKQSLALPRGHCCGLRLFTGAGYGFQIEKPRLFNAEFKPAKSIVGLGATRDFLNAGH